ncbi:MAG: right-handed parallel beta-helix repeat-containing protein [Planctomycetaceae bacterium]|nr:right-handed parallel beta-helix repeat-containing protein [Planctomycetales bacterium]MCB9937059.1 right-handed parallel beta-helix repeat-containing protein [Planctomycetaceae bacterium]
MSLAKHFGAIGDGIADDTDALQHAVDDGDGVLELSKGTYRITRSIVLDSRKHGYLGVRGDQGTGRVVMAGAGPALQIIGDHQGTATPESFKPHTWDRERMPMVTGLEILGEHPDADGIELCRTVQATIQNVLIRRCRHGVRLVERNRNFVLNASHIYDCHDTGVFFDACNLHQVIIAACHISYCKRAGIRQLNGDVHNIQITGNDIEYNSGYEGPGQELTGEIVLEARDGIISEYTIASNTIQATLDAPGANVLILGKAEDPPSGIRLVAITGNVLGSRDRNIVIEHGSRVSISGNTIYGGQRLNCEFRHSRYITFGSNSCFSRPASYASETTDGMLLDNCVGCSLVGNVLNDCRLGDEQGGGAITIRESQDIAVSGSQILNPSKRGVDVVDSSRCNISGNSIHETGEVKQMLAAIRVAGKGSGNWVHGNSVTVGSRGDIQGEAPSTRVDGNHVI